jgi:hypothetical protein
MANRAAEGFQVVSRYSRGQIRHGSSTSGAFKTVADDIAVASPTKSFSNAISEQLG